MFAEIHNDGSSTGASATAVNRGRVTIENDSDGVTAAAHHGGTANNPNAIIARNEATERSRRQVTRRTP